jgi:hypothetical protein
MPWARDVWGISLQIRAERGYLIPAWGDVYVKCAQHLRDSILEWHPQADITILTDLPHGDLGGYANDWQVFGSSPYRQTIKLEADMFCAGPIDHWWTLFEKRDVVISQGARDFYNEPAKSRHYRAVFDANGLPDLYNAITYWRLSSTAKEFFDLVRTIFQEWTLMRRLLKFPEERPSTDVVYAMAAVIMGPERVTLPRGIGPTIVHMKQHITGTRTPDWTRELIWEFTRPGLRINTVAQRGLVHYHIKDWLDHDT